MSKKTRCGKCGQDPARGFSTIDGVRYCHEGPSPTCYQRVWYEDLQFGTDEDLVKLGLRSAVPTTEDKQ